MSPGPQVPEPINEDPSAALGVLGGAGEREALERIVALDTSDDASDAQYRRRFWQAAEIAREALGERQEEDAPPEQARASLAGGPGAETCPTCGVNPHPRQCRECDAVETRNALRGECGRLLVGRGDDTYDPLCVLRAGHAGPCEPENEEPAS